MREEEKKQSSRGFKRFLKKRWVLPTVYILSAAIILTGVLWYQNSGDSADKNDYKSTDIAKKQFNEPSVEVNKSMETLSMPVGNEEQTVIQKKFYDNAASEKDQEAALVFYNNTYVPNTGLDIAMKDGSSFDVLAALSGTVTRVEEDSLLGNLIEVQHDTGIVTHYQSVKDIKVKAGDTVDKGDVLAAAGQSLLNEKAGTHVHFEIRKDGVAVNPQNYFDKPLSALQQEQVGEQKAANKKAAVEEDNNSPKPVDKEDAKEDSKESSEQPADDSSSEESGDNSNS
ncbi:peptidase M23 [Bacillus sp. FJAT-27225]|uniref:M23 family metallopeptidase n=1 Tax=Bacillus sp. FJAT-27225 TaxID=1743144 RepID=UPI00080C2C99|nr:M23 family metallopeptidase [Bacillus sp. FJAT-27225]OCA82422.1 peptidase M23 [Bacillus sp. FJAT-27225]